MTLTSTVLVATVILLVVYDIAAVLVFGGRATISTVIYESSKKWPIIPFAIGVLCGHLFWTQ